MKKNIVTILWNSLIWLTSPLISFFLFSSSLLRFILIITLSFVAILFYFFMIREIYSIANNLILYIGEWPSVIAFFLLIIFTLVFFSLIINLFFYKGVFTITTLFIFMMMPGSGYGNYLISTEGFLYALICSVLALISMKLNDKTSGKNYDLQYLALLALNVLFFIEYIFMIFFYMKLLGNHPDIETFASIGLEFIIYSLIGSIYFIFISSLLKKKSIYMGYGVLVFFRIFYLKFKPKEEFFYE